MVEGILTGGTDTALASYSFADISAGIGLVTHYGGLAGTTPSNILSTNKFYSTVVKTESVVAAGAGSTTVFTKQIDVDFDVLLNKQTTIRGTIPMNVSTAQWTSGSAFSTYIIIRFRKWDGSTETELSTSGQSETITATGAGVYTYNMTTPNVVIPNSLIRRAEYLRVTIEMWYKKAVLADDGKLAIAHDPYARTVGWDTTGTISSILSIPVPVKIIL